MSDPDADAEAIDHDLRVVAQELLQLGILP